MSPTACSAQCRTVSVIWPLFMITVMPRAIPMMSATPRRSRAPSTNAVVSTPSLSRPITPMTMLNRMKDAVISGNHHHRVGSPMPRSSHGMTPYIITPKASPKTPRITLCWPVRTASADPSPTLNRVTFSSRMSATTELDGSRLDPIGVSQDEEDAEGRGRR